MDELATLLARTVRSPGSRAERALAAATVVRDRTAARWVGIYSVRDGLVVNEAWSGPAAPAHPTFAVTQGLTGHAVASGRVAVSNDVAHDPRYLTNQTDTGSELIVPVIRAGAVVGTLDVERDVVAGFDGDSIAAYERLAALLQPLWD